VLSLFASQQAYPGSQFPQFSIDVVSLARQTCTLDVGARHVVLVIRSAAGRVWSSADCAAAGGTFSTDLRRGVPTVLPISWNRRESRPGCAAGSAPALAGTYTAIATDGTLESNAAAFRLGAGQPGQPRQAGQVTGS
jgi:hypothetical protein